MSVTVECNGRVLPIKAAGAWRLGVPASTHIRTPWSDMRVGQMVSIERTEYRITAVVVEPAAEDDPEMGVVAGELVTTFTLEAAADAERPRGSRW